MNQQVKWAVAVAGAAAATAVIVAGGVAWLAPSGDPRVREIAAPTHRVNEQDQPSTTPAPSPSATPSRPACDHVERAFDPRTIIVPGVTSGAAVVTPPRDGDVPGTPPVTDEGKSMFAWDREQGIRPGDSAGNVLLNAHTWPDGSALGNKLLAELQRGDRIIVVGANRRLCYRVTERVEVLAEDGLPRYYDRDGPPRLAIVVCSGRRLGPGEWEKRTVWFASPTV